MKRKKFISCMIIIAIFMQISSSVFANTNSIKENLDEESNTIENSITSSENNTQEDNLLTENEIQDETNVDDDIKEINEENSIATNNNEQNNVVENNASEDNLETSNDISTYQAMKINTGRTQDNGIYKINIGKDPNKAIEVGGGSTYNDATIDIWDFGDAQWQKYYFEYVDGYYKITAMHTGKSLTVKGNNLVEGTQIIQSDYQALESQKWILRDSNKNGWIISLQSNPELSISVEGNITNGAKMILSKTEDNDNQMFWLNNITSSEQNHANGTYRMAVGVDLTKAIGIKGSSKEENASIEIKKYGNKLSQKFNLEYIDGYYKITSAYSGKSLTVKDNDLREGAEIVQVDYQGLDSQKWILRDSNKKGWVISLLSNPQLSITVEGNIANGSRMILSKTEDNDNQMYNIESVSTEQTRQANGIYKIAVGVDPNKTIEVGGGSIYNDATTDIWDFGNAQWQKYYFEYEDGYYKITAMHTRKSLTVKDNNLSEGTEIIQEDYKGLDSQKWVLRDTTVNGWIISLQSNPELSITVKGNIANGSKMILSKTEDNDNQMFYLYNITSSEKHHANGVYKMAVGADSNKAIEVGGGSIYNDATIDIWDFGNGGQQKFNFEYNEAGYYKITARHTGKSLTVKDNDLTEGTEIVQVDYQGLDSQKWILRDSNKNGWVISLLSNPLLSITVKGNISNGSNIILSKTENNDNQMFWLYNITEDERTMSDGIYKIEVGADSNKTIEVGGGSTYNDATIDIWDFGDAQWQKYYFEYENGYYKITAMHTGKSLTVKDNNLSEGTQIIQDDYQGLNSQKWILRDSNKDGWIISLLSNPQLSITVEGNITNGSKMILSKTQDNDNQMFWISNITEESKTQVDGIYKINVGKDPNKAIEIGGGSTYNNATTDIWDFGNAEWQKFYFEYNEDGYYKITARHTGKSLTVKDNNLVEGAEIVQADYQGLDSQKWILRDSNKNGWIISLLSNPQLSISIEGNITNGAKMILSKTQDNDNQMFWLSNITLDERTFDNATYELAIGKEPSKAVEVPGGSEDAGSQLGIWDYGNAEWQKFRFEYDNGYYKITAGHTGMSLTVKDNNIAEGTEIVQDDYQGLDSQKWVLRDSNINGWVISPLYRPDLAITVENTIANGSQLVLESLQYNDRQMLYCYKTYIGVDIDSSKYPGIAEAVNNLMVQHPNWQFEVLYTGIDFYSAVQGEYEYYSVDKNGNKQPANLVDTNVYKGDWIAPNPIVIGNWAQASYNGIAYFMDPRNFINDVDVFQFTDLADYYNSGATLDSIQYQVNGTFLNDFAEDVRISCEHQNVNPYYIIARLFQEQSRDGSITIYMDGGDGKTYFNPFNVGAVAGDDFNTALAKAKELGWDSMQKGIEGGITFIKQNYLDVKQNTLYLNKFDVNPNSGSTFYTHQYQQNLSAAYSEARTFRGAYVDTGTLDNTIKFIIPVYENMPETPSAKPTGTATEPDFPKITDQGPKSVQVVDIQTSLKVRSGPGQQYGELEKLQNGAVLLSIVRYDNEWQKVITPSGTVGYCSGEFLQFIDDVINCNERVEISTSGSVNIRIGPGQSYTSLGMYRNGTKGVRILKDTYYADGYTWDLVILDDGIKGFIASKYLRIL